MMYHIALCDDEAAELDKTEQMLSEYQKRHAGVSFLTERFERADELLHLIREKSYVPDLLLMDIYMPMVILEIMERLCYLHQILE